MVDLPDDLARQVHSKALDTTAQARRWFRGSEPYALGLVDVIEPFVRDAARAGYAHGRAAASNCGTEDGIICRLPGDAYCGGCLEAQLSEANEQLEAARDRERGLEALVQRASTDSCVTTSDGPGCFYCDHETHTADCPAAAALTRADEIEREDG